MAVIIPGLRTQNAEALPEMRSLIDSGVNLLTTDRWRSVWSRSQHLAVKQCRHMTSGRQAWLEWQKCENAFAAADTAWRNEETGKQLRFIEMIGQVNK